MDTADDVFAISFENIEQEIEDYDRFIRSNAGPNTIAKALAISMISGFALGLRTMAKKDPAETEKIAKEYSAIAARIVEQSGGK